ncbi:MAG: colicin M resistance protein CbrA, partial [Citrobacter sp.]
SYALDSAESLKSVLLRDAPDMNHAYRKATRKLRVKLFGKILKSRALTSAFSRKWIMRSGVAHIPSSQEEQPAVTADGLVKEH